MNQPLNYSIGVFTMLLGLSIIGPGTSINKIDKTPVTNSPRISPKIQAAILLDVSNSMDGLIEQAKNQLWSMVSVMGKVKCADGLPQIEIALYEYGRPDNDPKAGYVKQISGFTTDLDQLSQELYKLRTNGGDEYCGHVIYSSLEQLNWDTSSASYKVIFIAGNEDFLQGDILYTKACMEAKKKGVIVNTIYCGSKEKGIEEHWDLGAECGSGSFTNIDQQAKPVIIPTPYDTDLIALNRKITGTYLYYGERGYASYRSLGEADTAPVTDVLDPTKIIKYKVVRNDSRFYDDSGWDLVNASAKDSGVLRKLNKATLNDSLKQKTNEELKKIIEAKAEERKAIKKQITSLDKQRDDFIAAEKMKKTSEPQTLETAIEKIIKEQVKRFKMTIE